MKHESRTPRYFFLSLGIMASLVFFIIGLLGTIFQWSQVLFPDTVTDYIDPYSSAMRGFISIMVISFPVLVIVTWVKDRSNTESKEVNSLTVTKWLSYMSLFVSIVVMIIDLIIVLQGFLSGELTSRFILKAGATLVIMGGVTAYLISELNGWWLKRKVYKAYLAVCIGVLLIGLMTWIISTIGSPSYVRNLRIDEQKISDLQNIQWKVLEFYQKKGVLPSKLSDLESSIIDFRVPLDPETERDYEYSIREPRTFTLCADFNLAMLDRKHAEFIDPYLPEYPDASFPARLKDTKWNHDSGRQCFERVVDPVEGSVNKR